MFKEALSLSLSFRARAAAAQRVARDPFSTLATARAAWHDAHRIGDEAYKARLHAAARAVREGVPLTYCEGQQGGVFTLPYSSVVTVYEDIPSIQKVDNAVSARGLYRQLKGYNPSWQELEGFVEEVCAPRTPHHEGRALRSNPILRDLADG